MSDLPMLPNYGKTRLYGDWLRKHLMFEGNATPSSVAKQLFLIMRLRHKKEPYPVLLIQRKINS